MSAWFERLVGPEYATLAMWVFAGVVLLILLVIFVRLLRGLAAGTFVAGGRNRRARLAVMDAAAVDSRRRLVLVRRDDVEHLILIGGPTDLVIEQDIRMITPGRRQAPATQQAPAPREAASPTQTREPAAGAPRPRLVSPPAPAHAPAKAPEPVSPAAGARDSRPATEPVAEKTAPAVTVGPSAPASPAPTSYPRVDPVAPKPHREPEAAGNGAAPAREMGVVTPLPIAPDTKTPAVAASGPDDDEALMRELEVTLDTSERKHPDEGRDEISLEEEMSKLLGDLSGDRR